MKRRSALTMIFMYVVLLGLCSTAQAQWSLLAPGKREAPAGQNRYSMLVLANPVPGLEQQFDDWYTNTHIGDLTQLPGWVGTQRFRIVSSLNPRPTRNGYTIGYLIIWDQEGPDYATPQKLMTEAIAGGKSRRGAGFDYVGGNGGGGTFQAIGPRIVSKGPWMPPVTDAKTPRPNRYLVMDYSAPLAGMEKEFEASQSQHIKDVLALPGWVAAQRYKMAPLAAGRRASKPEYLTLWETEGKDVNDLQATFNGAVKSGQIKPLPIDEATWEFTYWTPITPYVTKEDFIR